MPPQPKKAPIHLPIALGLTGGLYAVTLAGVTALQSRTDATLAAAHQPLESALGSLETGRSALASDLNATLRTLNDASDAYAGSAEVSAALQQTLADLAARVASATGAAARLPASVALPSAPRARTVIVAPAAHATTGASGAP